MAEAGAGVDGNPCTRPAAFAASHRDHGAGHHAATQGVYHRNDPLLLCFHALVRSGLEHVGHHGGNDSIPLLVLCGGQRGFRLVDAESRTVAVGGGAVDRGHQQPGGRPVPHRDGAFDRRVGQHFILAVCGSDGSKRRQCAARFFPTHFKLCHQPLLHPGGGVGCFRGQEPGCRHHARLEFDAP